MSASRSPFWRIATSMVIGLASSVAFAQPIHLRALNPQILRGVAVAPADEQRLGLVTVNGGCSGTLLNRFWVLTARHCVTTDASINGPLLPPERVSITATYAPGRVGQVLRLSDISGNTRDIVLIYLGVGDLGDTHEQPIFKVMRAGATRDQVITDSLLREAHTVVQFGRGYSTLASGVWGGTPPAQPATGLGTYRSARLKPSRIDGAGYTLVLNPGNQAGHGGDSGGPTWYTDNEILYGIAGVQSTCAGTFLPGAPLVPDRWRWATSIQSCYYVSTAPYMREIARLISEVPSCTTSNGDGACGLAHVVDIVLNP